MRSGKKKKKTRRRKSRSVSFFCSVCAAAHRFHFHSFFRRLLCSQVETQHLIGQLTDHRGAEGERSQVKHNPSLNNGSLNLKKAISEKVCIYKMKDETSKYFFISLLRGRSFASALSEHKCNIFWQTTASGDTLVSKHCCEWTSAYSLCLKAGRMPGLLL